MKTLKALQDRDTAEMMRKLEATRRKEMKELAKKHKDREEMDRMKRELASNAVERGVSERVRLEEMYELKRKELEEKYQTVRSSIDIEKKKVSVCFTFSTDYYYHFFTQLLLIAELLIFTLLFLAGRYSAKGT